jgi:hypothetical protein
MLAVAVEMFSRLLISATSSRISSRYFQKRESRTNNSITVRGTTRKAPSIHTTNRNLLPYLRGSFSHEHFLSTSFVRALPCSLSRIRKTSSSWLRDGSLGMHAEIKGARSPEVFVRNSVQARSINLGAELCQLGVPSSYFFCIFFVSIRYLLYVSLWPPPLASTSAWTTARHCDCMSKTSPRLCLRNALCRKAEMNPLTFTCPKRPANFGQRSLFHEI